VSSIFQSRSVEFIVIHESKRKEESLVRFTWEIGICQQGSWKSRFEPRLAVDLAAKVFASFTHRSIGHQPTCTIRYTAALH
jgi:hypothetical protein